MNYLWGIVYFPCSWKQAARRKIVCIIHICTPVCNWKRINLFLVLWLLYSYRVIYSDNYFYILIHVRLRTEVPSTLSSTRPGLTLMTPRSWQYISCHWDACSSHLVISATQRNGLPHYLRGLRWFQMHGLSDRLIHWQFRFWFMYDLGQKYQAPQARPDWGLNSWPPDHDSTFHVTETPALATWPSVTHTQAKHNKKLWITFIGFNTMTHEQMMNRDWVTVSKCTTCYTKDIWTCLKRHVAKLACDFCETNLPSIYLPTKWRPRDHRRSSTLLKYSVIPT